MRAIFFGSPAFAVPCLDALVDVAEVVAVVSQPDRPAGRGLSMRPPAVKVRALELGLPVMQPKKVRTEVFAEHVRSLDADVGLVVAYGRILPRAVLDAPRGGCVNVHASLLPLYRGAAPIQWAIVEGEEKTGVTLMQMDEGMDTGPILSTIETPIGVDETAQQLGERLSSLGADLVRRDLAAAVAGDLPPRPQDDASATMAPLLGKADGRIRWAEGARRVHDRVRGMSPWPGAFTTIDGKTLKIHGTRMVGSQQSATPGEVLDVEAGTIRVGCGSGAVEILELQESGKKRMSADRYLAGAGRWLAPGIRFDVEEAIR